MELMLRELNIHDEKAFFEGMKSWEGEELSWHTFAWQEGMTYPEMLEILRKERLGIELRPDRVAHTMLYGFVNGEIIGRVSVRHELNDYLLRRGGHIGYGVAPRFRKKGYASEMARKSLDYCRSLGLSKILVTCADDNEPSWKIIEQLGGVLENKIWDDEAKENIRRYWVNL